MIRVRAQQHHGRAPGTRARPYCGQEPRPRRAVKDREPAAGSEGWPSPGSLPHAHSVHSFAALRPPCGAHRPGRGGCEEEDDGADGWMDGW
eukprot:scaffold133_cov407-Prasinococcus_capsulatus_cf.AAC.14